MNSFCKSEFNGDISNWDMSNVENMYRMFGDSKFNGDISKWNVSIVKDMNWMFNESQFNGDNKLASSGEHTDEEPSPGEF